MTGLRSGRFMLKRSFKKVESRLLAEVKRLYGHRLVSVVIFGSLARQTQTFDSDIDVLIIPKKLPKGRMKRVTEFEAVESRMEPLLQSLRKEAGINTYISPVIKTPEEAGKGSPLFIDMIQDANVLFDKGGFFGKVLDGLRGRLERLGAKRVWRGNAWYWILKPDYRPGEIFEI